MSGNKLIMIIGEGKYVFSDGSRILILVIISRAKALEIITNISILKLSENPYLPSPILIIGSKHIPT